MMVHIVDEHIVFPMDMVACIDYHIFLPHSTNYILHRYRPRPHRREDRKSMNLVVFVAVNKRLFSSHTIHNPMYMDYLLTITLFSLSD